MVMGARITGSKTNNKTNTVQVMDLRVLVILPPSLPATNAVPTEMEAPSKEPNTPGTENTLPPASAVAYAHARRSALAIEIPYRIC